jgi:DNA-binding PadR family transcriptional regulator
MRILQSHSAGMYGLEIVSESENELSRGSIYVLLGRLEEKGLVQMLKGAKGKHPGMPRPRYKLSAVGCKVLGAADAVAGVMQGARP